MALDQRMSPLPNPEKTMTRTTKLAAVATLAFAVSITLMFVLQAYAPDHAHMLEAGVHTRHSMTAMWEQMGWQMAFAPVAGILFFGSIVTFITLFVRWIAK